MIPVIKTLMPVRNMTTMLVKRKMLIVTS